MIDMEPFCDPDDVRLRSPWNEGGFSYATDRAIIVRVPTNVPDSPPLDGLGRPNAHVNALFTSQWKDDSDFVPWPHEQCPMCETCSGSGFMHTTGTCGECGGSGSVECQCCGSDTTCEQCEGDGIVENHPACACLDGFTMELNESNHISAKYVRLISTLPGVKYRNEDNKILFRFDGYGQGICMARATK